ncbi:hypothetical protein FDECE_7634 [Fusarium decemcellulare]|nr:hypothetical protein FDECE_7634 [Fusarium decemcellulare]
MDSSGQHYNYEPLPPQGWFRLLTIEPSEDESSVISCTLEHQQISSSIQYEAISYTWGDEELTESILVNGHHFNLKPNLSSALSALRHRKTPRTIWVDAICINQLDESERNHQVWQMYDIYSRATAVNVWLGEATEGSDKGIDFLEKFHALLYHDPKGPLAIVGSTIDFSEWSGYSSHDSPRYPVYPACLESYHDFYGPVLSLLDDPKAQSDLDGAVKLLSRLWWKRMWTLQESVLCPNVLCWCGSRTFPINYLYHLSYFVYFSVNFNAWKGLDIDPQVSLRTVFRAADLNRHMATRKRVRMVLALDSTWNRKASDPKDKIIGILGLLRHRKDLEPEYSWPVERVYRVAMRAALLEEGPNCLGLMSERRESRNKKLSSWVPDFGLHNNRFSNHTASLSKPIFLPGVFDASLREGSQLDFSRVIRTENDDTILVLPGILVDTVLTVGSTAPGWQLEDTSDSGLEKWMDNMRSVLGEWRTLPLADVYRTGEPIGTSFWRTVLVDLKQGEYPNPSSAIGAKRLDDRDKQELGRLNTPQGLEKLLRTWAACVKNEYRHLRFIEQFNRRFFVTKAGYMGLGPCDLQPGDTINVLLGGSVANALRDNGDGTWRYIGECYVHGIMDGEMTSNAQSGLREFRIV